MGRDYIVCDHCGDLLPLWIDGFFLCSCRTESICNETWVECDTCKKLIKEQKADCFFKEKILTTKQTIPETYHMCEDCLIKNNPKT